MLAQLIGAFVIILIGFTLMPMLQESVESATLQTNETNGAAQTLVQVTPIFFTIGIVGIVISIVYGALKSGGLIGGYDYEEINNIPEPVVEKPRKMTYLDYVRERLSVEKMLKWRI